MENTATEVEVVSDTELVEDVSEAVVNSIDDMTDEQFAEEFDKDTTETDEPKTEEPEPELDDNQLYKAQIEDNDIELDREVLLKHDGEVMRVKNLNDLRNLAEKGFNAQKKFQKLAEDRKALEAQLKALGETPDVVNDEVSEIESIADNILKSSYADTFKSDVGVLPPEAKEMISSDPRMLSGLAQDYESGLAQQIMPAVKREMTIKGIDFIQAYISVGRRVTAEQENVATRQKVLKSEPKRGNYKQSVPDVNSMSDAEFDKYFANL